MVFLEVVEGKESAFRIKVSLLSGLCQLSAVWCPCKDDVVCRNSVPLLKTTVWALLINMGNTLCVFHFPLEWNLKLHVLLEYQLLSSLKLERRSHNWSGTSWWPVLRSPLLWNCAQIASTLELTVFVLRDLLASKVLIGGHGSWR